MNEKNIIKQFVIFKLENEEYGIDILRVKTIEKMSVITRVPKAPPYIKGVITLRGEVVPIIDLREKFNVKATEESENTRIIIIYVDDVTIGLIVDSVSEVTEIDSASIEESPEAVGNIEISNICGIGKLNDRIIILLDAYKILNI